MLVELIEANRSNSWQIESLLDDYLGELSGYREVSVGATAAVNYPYLDAYWSEPGRHAFLIQCSGRVVGFAFIREPSSTESAAHQVAEFYVKRESRRLGIGRRAILSIWTQFAGEWELQVHSRNASAIRFWRSCVEAEANEEPQLSKFTASDGQRLQFNFRIG